VVFPAPKNPDRTVTGSLLEIAVCIRGALEFMNVITYHYLPY
jgi:hypothetical protein